MEENQFNNLSISVEKLDPANDCLQFYCFQNNKEIIFTDDGYYVNAFNIDSEHIKHYGLEQRGDELILRGKVENFAMSKKSYIQALLGVLANAE